MALGEGEALRQLGQLANDTKEIWRLSFEVLGARINSLDSLIRVGAVHCIVQLSAFIYLSFWLNFSPLSLHSHRNETWILDIHTIHN
eukprot:1061797-Amorphochlora_amoeboformis.AAC.1